MNTSNFVKRYKLSIILSSINLVLLIVLMICSADLLKADFGKFSFLPFSLIAVTLIPTIFKAENKAKKDKPTLRIVFLYSVVSGIIINLLFILIIALCWLGMSGEYDPLLFGGWIIMLIIFLFVFTTIEIILAVISTSFIYLEYEKIWNKNPK